MSVPVNPAAPSCAVPGVFPVWLVTLPPVAVPAAVPPPRAAKPPPPPLATIDVIEKVPPKAWVKLPVRPLLPTTPVDGRLAPQLIVSVWPQLAGTIAKVETHRPPELPPLPTMEVVDPPPPPPPPSISTVMLEQPDGIVILWTPAVVNVEVVGVKLPVAPPPP